MGELALTEEIKTLGLEKYAEELERDGLTIVPPEVNGFGVDRIDEIVELILARAREMTGCTFTLDGGPHQELEFPKREFTPKQLERFKARGLNADELNRPTQFLIQKLTQQHRLFRDLALNPASLALQNFKDVNDALIESGPDPRLLRMLCWKDDSIFLMNGDEQPRIPRKTAPQAELTS